MTVLSCTKVVTDGDADADSEGYSPEYYVNLFTYNNLRSYYLWNKEISTPLDDWKMDFDPKKQVENSRFKDDKWTEVTDDYESYIGSMNGTQKSNGLRALFVYGSPEKKTIYAIVTFTYKDSPADKAGLVRGDVITGVNGTPMTPENYYGLAQKFYFEDVTLDFLNGPDKKLTAAEIYEDPVGTTKTFDLGDSKVGYIHYSGFTQSSIKPMVEILDSFRKDGVKTLILDLRYNGGGHTMTEQALASMLAPEEYVRNGGVFMQEIYNDKITEARGGVTTVKFSTEFTYKDSKGVEQTVSTLGKNMNLSRLYVLVSDRSASASESIICGLKAFMDVVVIGRQTRGKFCGGSVFEGSDWYEGVKADMASRGRIELYNKGVKIAKNWGIYIMIARYADKNGITLSMPNGIEPDFESRDMPEDGKQLGDPSETMLAKALDLAGYRKTATQSSCAAVPESHVAIENQPEFPGWGVRIIDL